MKSKLTIIGTGFIGTSLGLAIRARDSGRFQVVGTDINRANAAGADAAGAVDTTSDNLREAVEGAQVVVLATPLKAMKDVMEIIGPGLEDGCLVTDTAGIKAPVMEWAREYLPDRVTFVGGHPIVFRGGTGPDSADANLFAGCPYCVIPSPGARQDRVKDAVQLVQSVGAVDRFIDSAEHDTLIAAVDNLPLLLSAALVGCASRSQSWDDIAILASRYFGEMTTLVKEDTAADQDSFFFNESATVAWIDNFIRELYRIRQVLESENKDKDSTLSELLEEARAARQKWLDGAVTSETLAAIEGAKVPPKSSMLDIVTGDRDARERAFGWGGRMPDRRSKDKERGKW